MRNEYLFNNKQLVGKKRERERKRKTVTETEGEREKERERERETEGEIRENERERAGSIIECKIKTGKLFDFVFLYLCLSDMSNISFIHYFI